MEFTCANCGGWVIDGICEDCHATYLTVCSRCGNNLSFEQVEVGGQTMLRCTECDNQSDLQMVAVNL